VVAQRIREIYKRDATVIPPPIDVSRFSQNRNEPEEDYYLILSRLISYKRLDVAIEACRKLNRRLIVIGDGPDRKRLEGLAGKNTTFLGRQSDKMVVKYANRCRALLFPGEEDFGMTPLELNAAGKPIIAFYAGGAMETVLENVTGVFFNEQTPDSMADAIKRSETINWNRKAIRRHAKCFDKAIFAERILDFLGEVAPASCSRQILKSNGYSPLVLDKRAAA
jgi:glycosyltransferase involved in cell wall biosynthesis